MGTTAGYPLGAHLDAVAVRDLALGFYAVGRHGAAELRQLPESDGDGTPRSQPESSMTEHLSNIEAPSVPETLLAEPGSDPARHIANTELGLEDNRTSEHYHEKEEDRITPPLESYITGPEPNNRSTKGARKVENLYGQTEHGDTDTQQAKKTEGLNAVKPENEFKTRIPLDTYEKDDESPVNCSEVEPQLKNHIKVNETFKSDPPIKDRVEKVERLESKKHDLELEGELVETPAQTNQTVEEHPNSGRTPTRPPNHEGVQRETRSNPDNESKPRSPRTLQSAQTGNRKQRNDQVDDQRLKHKVQRPHTSSAQKAHSDTDEHRSAQHDTEVLVQPTTRRRGAEKKAVRKGKQEIEDSEEDEYPSNFSDTETECSEGKSKMQGSKKQRISHLDTTTATSAGEVGWTGILAMARDYLDRLRIKSESKSSTEELIKRVHEQHRQMQLLESNYNSLLYHNKEKTEKHNSLLHMYKALEEKHRHTSELLTKERSTVNSLRTDIASLSNALPEVLKDDQYFNNTFQSIFLSVEQWVLQSFLGLVVDSSTLHLLSGQLQMDLYKTWGEDWVSIFVQDPLHAIEAITLTIFRHHIFETRMLGILKDSVSQIEQYLNSSSIDEIFAWRRETYRMVLAEEEFPKRLQKRVDEVTQIIEICLEPITATSTKKARLRRISRMKAIVASAAELAIECSKEPSNFSFYTYHPGHKCDPMYMSDADRQEGHETLGADGACVRLTVSPAVVRTGRNRDDDPILILKARVVRKVEQAPQMEGSEISVERQQNGAEPSTGTEMQVDSGPGQEIEDIDLIDLCRE